MQAFYSVLIMLEVYGMSGHLAEEGPCASQASHTLGSQWACACECDGRLRRSRHRLAGACSTSIPPSCLMRLSHLLLSGYHCPQCPTQLPALRAVQQVSCMRMGAGRRKLGTQCRCVRELLSEPPTDGPGRTGSLCNATILSCWSQARTTRASATHS